ncbi:hypothetical protein [Candidatus Accumulibacter contiguus]|uniref:hypothetical protein n=1 Tax=Candidatus Accumulibacter contiguus TaxID=2954381 RepID=UPI00207BC2E8|nr:hypothetical protein [Candidatus Accumulibacter contiguus]
MNRSDLRCSHERAFLNDGNGTTTVLRLSAQTFALGGKESQNIAFEYQGSILSALKDSELPAPLLAFRDALRRVRSLELLSPEKLRKSARVSEHDIGAGGEKLSAYLDNIKGEQKNQAGGTAEKVLPSLGRLQDYVATIWLEEVVGV